MFGGAALHSEIFNGSGLAEVAGQNSSQALFALLGELPLAWLTSILATILILVFFITSGDSATLVLATMSTDGDVNPKNRTKIIWGVLVSGIALVLLMAGGLKAVTIVFALPFSLVLVLMAIALVRAIRQDWQAHEVRERQLRKKMERLLHPSD